MAMVVQNCEPTLRTSSGTAYNVLITGIKYTVDAGYKNTLGSSNIGSYNRCSYIRHLL